MSMTFTERIRSFIRKGFISTVSNAHRYLISCFGQSMERTKYEGGYQDRYDTPRSALFSAYEKSVNLSYPPSVALAVGKISDSLLNELNAAIESGVIKKTQLTRLDSRNQDHLFLLTDCGKHKKYTERLMDENLTVCDIHKFNSSHILVNKLHSEIRSLFHAEVGSPFVFVNTRMWISHPLGDRFGPNALHLDGFEAGHLKVMVYLSPLDIEHGYLEVKDGEIRQIIGKPPGVAVLFRNSDLEHSGVPGTKFPRISIEVTLMRSHIDASQTWAGHFYGRHLIDPTIFNHSNEVQVKENRIEPKEQAIKIECDERQNGVQELWYIADPNRGLRVNIGSGIRNWQGWICLDEIRGKGVTNITFNPNVSLPLPNNSTSLIYSSHCFEHLESKTLSAIMREIRRVSMCGALFILKIPDYEYFLRQYRKGVHTAMDNKGIESVVHTWKGVIEDNVINRLCMMFCGYWNQAYGDHFSGNIQTLSHAYHGPPKLPSDILESIFNSSSPKHIAQELRTFALKAPDFKQFNHQSAWSRKEMNELLEEEGFNVLSNSSPVIIKKFSEFIPDLRSMESWSAYYLAEIK